MDREAGQELEGLISRYGLPEVLKVLAYSIAARGLGKEGMRTATSLRGLANWLTQLSDEVRL